MSSRNALPALRDDTTNGCGADKVLTGYKLIKHLRLSLIEYLSNQSTLLILEENKRGDLILDPNSHVSTNLILL